MVKILKVMLQQCMNQELTDVQVGFRKKKAEKTEIKLPTFVGLQKKQGNPRKKNIYFCFIDYAKALDCVDHNKLWKILKRWEYQTTLPVC